MVQSIWLKFKKEDMTPLIINEVIKTVKGNYKCYAFQDPKMENTTSFKFLDCCQIKTILEEIKMNIDDKKLCDCGCFSTEFERLCYFIDLEFTHGSFTKTIPDIEYYMLGRNVWGSIGMYAERLSVLFCILQNLQKKLKEKGINCRLDLSDCEKDLIKKVKK